MLRSPTDWIWDFWLADDGSDFHMFYLHAPRSLGDPDLRHWSVSIGHAVSPDLQDWVDVGDALAPGSPGGIDDRATWTGSVVRRPDGTWVMFYTAASSAENGLVQRVGVARSPDLYTWSKQVSAVLEAEPQWYEKLDAGQWFDEAWRDPWVFPDPSGVGWHMLITARAAAGAPDQRGVIAHATSPDLAAWTVGPPLSTPGSGFGHLEVPQVATVEGRTFLVFSCLGEQLSDARRAAGQRGGIWAAPSPGLLGPYDTGRAEALTDESLYSGRLIQDRTGQWVLLAFRNTEDGRFVGEITDPLPVTWSNTDPARLTVVARELVSPDTGE